MRSELILILALFSLALTAQVPAKVQADARSLRLVKQTQPDYPAIARLAHVGGEVKLQVTIGPDGHVTSSKILSGPEMLAEAAKDCVQEWIYDPIVDTSGKPAPAITVVSLMFNPTASRHRPDEKMARRFFPLHRECKAAVSSQQDTARQAETCSKAAQAAEMFDPGERFSERRSAFVYASTASLRNQESQQALDYANKAVLTAEQGHDDGAGASAAYSVRAQAEAVMGNLAKALNDLSKSEQYERIAIDQMTTTAPELVKRRYVPTLKYILNLEARVLTATGKNVEAAAKASEATKL
jgi:TonB family protein